MRAEFPLFLPSIGKDSMEGNDVLLKNSSSPVQWQFFFSHDTTRVILELIFA